MPKKTETKTETGTGTDLTEEQITDVVKKKRRGAKWMQELTDEGVGFKPGENARYIRNALASWGLPPIDISDPKQVEERIGMYFRHCAENDRRPQIVGMCNWLGISRQALNEWKNGESRNTTHGDIIKRAYDLMEEMWTDYMTNGKISPPTGIFLAKNWYGYKDIADVVVTPNNPLNGLDADTARQRLVEAVPDEDDE